MRSKTVVTTRSPMRTTGTTRVTSSISPWAAVSKRGRRISAVRAAAGVARCEAGGSAAGSAGAAVAQGAVGDRDPTGALVPDGGLELGVGGVGLGGDGAAEVGGGDEAAGPVAAVAVVFEVDEEGQVRVGADIGVEVVGLRVDEELLEDDVAHRHRQGPVGAGGRGQPFVGELHVLRIVRGDGDDLLPVVAGLGHPVGVG